MGSLELYQLRRFGSGYGRDNYIELCEQSFSYAQSDASARTRLADLPEELVWIIKPGCSGDDNHRPGHFWYDRDER